jgi:hypothetical protein
MEKYKITNTIYGINESDAKHMYFLGINKKEELIPFATDYGKAEY